MAQIVEHPDCIEQLSAPEALALLMQLGVLQTRLVAIAAGAFGSARAEPGPTCYDIPEVAARLKLDVSNVYKLCKRGELATFKQGRAVRVRREDLERFIQERLNGGRAIATR